MAIDLEDDILQDFLVEAGEILETLNEQLVDLEKTPEDSDLLNSIFRGFHTIKGGGSFLALDNLVAVCHKSEDVFNLLRNHEISLNADMMDTFLRVLDEVNSMFEEIKSGEDPTAAPDDVMQKLVEMQDPDVAADSAEVEEAEETQQVTDVATDPAKAAEEFVSGKDEITDEEFESLLDVLHGSGEPPKVVEANKSVQETGSSDEISDDEFEALLDELQGKGAIPAPTDKTKSKSKAKSKSETETKPKPKPKSKVAAVKAKPAAKSKAPGNKDKAGSDEISDDEFEALLDEMHGKGKGPANSKPKTKASPKPTSTPEVKAPPKKTESKARPAPKKAAAPAVSKGETTVRVDTARLDDIMNLVGELVLTRNRLNTLRQTFEDERVHKAISSLDVVTADLQTAVMKTRMQPVKKVFGRFPRVVRDLARTLKKEIVLELKGEETDLDKNLVEALADPLVHLVRNSVDHGIELPDIREQAGKPREGKVILSAQQEGDHIILSIIDDGAGMDPEVLRGNAVKKGLMDTEMASRLDDKGCFDLIFMPGLSTKEKISDVSGRGVGMDVVKTKISQLNGLIEINSTLGKGTELRIKVPLTLAILPTLMIKLGTRKFALPLSIVNEIFELSSKKISVVDGKEVVLNRGKAPPIFHLRKWLLRSKEVDNDIDSDPHVIMVRVGNDSVGFVVDQVIGQEEVVIKPLDKLLQGLPGMAGSTITGDGNIAIILDIPGLLKAFS